MMTTTTPNGPAPARCEISQKFFFDAAHTLRRDIEA